MYSSERLKSLAGSTPALGNNMILGHLKNLCVSKVMKIHGQAVTAYRARYRCFGEKEKKKIKEV